MSPAIALAPLAFALLLPAQDGEFEASFRQATQAMRAGRLEEAASGFSRCTLLRPGFAEAWFNLGLVRLQEARWADASNLLQKAVALKPQLRGANLFAGIARYRSGEYAEAIKALQKETSLDPSNADALMWLGVTKLAEGDSEGAAAALDRAAKLKPDNVDILYHRGRAHMLLSKESYERMYQADPKSWRVHQVLAQSFSEAERLDDAAAEAKAAIDLKPGEPGLHESLGDIYWNQNQLELAEAEFQSELKIDPGSVAAQYKLAVISLERSKPDVAAGLLRDVLRKNPGSAEAHYQLGRALAQLGSNQEAERNFHAVVSESPQTGTEMVRQSYYQLAQIYRRMQRPQEARAALEQFTRLKQQADAEQEQKLQDKLKRAPKERPEP